MKLKIEKMSENRLFDYQKLIYSNDTKRSIFIITLIEKNPHYLVG
jgi:hypothetical protein